MRQEKLDVYVRIGGNGMEQAKHKKTYQTEQKRQLLHFLQENKTKQYTIDEMISHMEVDHMPGKSTIYRLMKQLVEEGRVKRCNKHNSRQFVYQLLDGEGCSMHFHMQCENCGRLFHMEEEETRQVQYLLHLKENFDIDIGRSLFLGVCAACK